MKYLRGTVAMWVVYVLAALLVIAFIPIWVKGWMVAANAVAHWGSYWR